MELEATKAKSTAGEKGDPIIAIDEDSGNEPRDVSHRASDESATHRAQSAKAWV